MPDGQLTPTISTSEMNNISPNYVKAAYVVVLPWLLTLAIGAVVLALVVTPWAWIAVAVIALLAGWLLWLIPARAKRMRWLETENDLLITKGRLWYTFTVVPYGRIQYVDVTAGPVWRAFDMKNVKLHTASATSDSTVRALPADVADALRDRLARQARERMSGL